MTWLEKLQAVAWIYVSKAFSKLAIKCDRWAHRCDRWAETCYKRAAALIANAKGPPPS